MKKKILNFYNDKINYIFNSILVLIIILSSYVFYKSEIYTYGESNFRIYYIYYLFLIFFFFVTVFFKNQKLRTKKNFLFYFFSSCFWLLCIEIFLEYNNKFFNKKNLSRINYYKNNPNKFERKNILPYFSGVTKISKFENNNNIILPLSEISNQEYFYCYKDEYNITFKTDKYGFVNENSNWKKSKLDFIIIGDSFGLSDCVGQENSINFLLKQKNDFLNLSVGNSGPLTKFAIIREYIKKKDVKNIFMFYNQYSELSNLQIELKSNILKKYLSDNTFNQNLITQQIKIDRLLNQFYKKMLASEKKIENKSTTFSSILKLQKIRRDILKINQLALNFNQNHEQELEIIKDIYLKSNNFLKNKNINIIIVIIPPYNKFEKEENYLKKLDTLIKFFEKNNIKYINIFESLDKKKFKKLFFDKHFNELGYKLFVNELLNYK